MKVTDADFPEPDSLEKRNGKAEFSYKHQNADYKFSTDRVTIWLSLAVISHDNGDGEVVGISWSFPHALRPGDNSYQLIDFKRITFEVAGSEYTVPRSGVMSVNVKESGDGQTADINGTVTGARISNGVDEVVFSGSFSATYP
ncbi:hypothetical protein [Pseudomonas lactucae]|uniref:hypothetical protein n=1 Tax=Pseudomonas lactucae TaxID=2813360 RepID=UPI00112F1C3D